MYVCIQKRRPLLAEVSFKSEVTFKREVPLKVVYSKEKSRVVYSKVNSLWNAYYF